MGAANYLSHLAGLRINPHLQALAYHSKNIAGSPQGGLFQGFVTAEDKSAQRTAPLDVSVGTFSNERPVFNAKGSVFHARGSFQGLFNGIHVQSVRDGKQKWEEQMAASTILQKKMLLHHSAKIGHNLFPKFGNQAGRFLMFQSGKNTLHGGLVLTCI